MGTTVATNALLERKGERIALAITRGLRRRAADRLPGAARHLRAQDRAAAMLYDRVVEIDERIGVDGEILRPLDEAAARAAFGRLRDEGYRALAIVLMHGWRWTAHEAALAAIAREIGFTQVSASHEVGPLIKLVGRGDTTVVDAYLSPVLGRYVDRVVAGLGRTAPAALHAVERRPDRRAAVPGQGRDPVGPGGRDRRHGRRRARGTAPSG